MPKKKSSVDPKLQARLDAKVRPDEPVKEDRIYYNMKPKKCAIVSTPRSGTHYLRISLNNHPKMEFASEFFRPENKYRTLPKYKKHFQINC